MGKTKDEAMTLERLLMTGLIKDSDRIRVSSSTVGVIRGGQWMQDHILDYMTAPLESFTWENGIWIVVLEET